MLGLFLEFIIRTKKDTKLVSFSKIGTSDSSLELEIDQLLIELGKTLEKFHGFRA